MKSVLQWIAVGASTLALVLSLAANVIGYRLTKHELAHVHRQQTNACKGGDLNRRLITENREAMRTLARVALTATEQQLVDDIAQSRTNAVAADVYFIQQFKIAVKVARVPPFKCPYSS